VLQHFSQRLRGLACEFLRQEAVTPAAAPPESCRPRVCSELACPLLRGLGAGVARAAGIMSAPGQQLPATLCDESQDAIAALYVLVQVGIMACCCNCDRNIAPPTHSKCGCRLQQQCRPCHAALPRHVRGNSCSTMSSTLPNEAPLQYSCLTMLQPCELTPGRSTSCSGKAHGCQSLQMGKLPSLRQPRLRSPC
jgi:hypothetical protein